MLLWKLDEIIRVRNRHVDNNKHVDNYIYFPLCIDLPKLFFIFYVIINIIKF